MPKYNYSFGATILKFHFPTRKVRFDLALCVFPYWACLRIG